MNEDIMTDEEFDALLDGSGDLEEQLEEDEINEEIEDVDDDGEEIIETAPAKTYQLDFETGEIRGAIDEELALRQFVLKALLTPRDVHEIYTSDYGSEIEEILAEQESADYVATELERVIREALEDDDRINSIDDVDITFEDDSIYAVITINSIYGELIEEVEI